MSHNGIEDQIKKNVLDLEKIFENREEIFSPYVRYIRFPQYKKIRNNEQISFDFPLTVLVGQNGCNKSSVLHALYGVPENKSTSKYWFSTNVDRISHGKVGPNCYVSGHYLPELGKTVEVLKTRIASDSKGEDYWETSRPISRYGMTKMPPMSKSDKEWRTKTRWKSIAKNVVYLDFRAILSAYDKCFYFDDYNVSKTVKTPQDFIRKRSKKLKKVLDNNLTRLDYFNVNRVLSNEFISAEQLEVISEILGYSYDMGRIVRHALYSSKADNSHMGTTIILKRSGIEYSEAFAGSGEFAVAYTVNALMAAPQKSLILLDEPEVSLHPLAQMRLLNFMLRLAKIKKHQFILATHSSYFYKHLPSCAIKSFEFNTRMNCVEICNNSSCSFAGQLLGSSPNNVLNVVVEDEVAKILLEHVIFKRDESLKEHVNITYTSGGCDSLITKDIPSFSKFDTPVLVILDGDQTPNEKIHPDDIPSSQDDDLDEIIKSLTGCDVKFYPDSGKKQKKRAQRIRLQRDFLKFYAERVMFLPHDIPEESIWELSSNEMTNDETLKADDYKVAMRKASQRSFGEANSEAIVFTCKLLLSTVDPAEECFDDIFNAIEGSVRAFF